MLQSEKALAVKKQIYANGNITSRTIIISPCLLSNGRDYVAGPMFTSNGS